jgi:hypothetical protein
MGSRSLSSASKTAWTGKGDAAAPVTGQTAGVYKPDDHIAIVFAFRQHAWPV